MTTADRLNAIAVKCRANLLLAEKRTPGEWHGMNEWVVAGTKNICQAQSMAHDADAAYIAACAGAAEAAWKATIAAINALETTEGGGTRHFLEADILAAWE